MKQNTNSTYQVAELQLIYKQKFKASERPKINTSADCYKVFLSLWNTGIMGFIEEFKILLLNRGNRVLGGDSDEIDHAIPAQTNHPFRSKLTTLYV